MLKKLSLLEIVFFSLIIFGCNCQENQIAFDYGDIEENIYTNSFFNLSMTLPADWSLQSQQETENLLKEGRKLVAGEDKNLENVLNAAEINTANLIMLYQHELGTAVDYNPSLMLVAENLRNAPGVKTGADYLFHARKLLSQAQIKYDHLDEEFEKVDINGQIFYLMNTNINYLGYEIKQKYYSTVLKGFSLNMIISYVSNDQKSELEQSINTLTFEL
jgi:hypothetical protein